MMSNNQKQLDRAKEIVQRYHDRGGVIPREQRDRSNPTKLQEYRDACKLKTWKYSLLGKNKYICSDEVKEYLDANMPGWRDRVYSHGGVSSSTQMQKAREIVQRYRERGNVRPQRTSDPSRHLEYKDAEYLGTWKSSLRGNNKVTCSSELRDYLDESMPGWRDDHRRRSISRNTTSNYVTNPINKNGQNVVISSEMSASLKRKCNDDAEAQNVQKRRNSLHIQLMKAHEVINRCLDRQQRGQHLLPRLIPGHQSATDLMLEQIDALELGEWKRAVLTQSEEFPWELKSYLDKHLPNWTGDATFHRENKSPTVRTYESSNFQLGTCRGSSTEFGSTSSLRDGQMQPHAPIMTNHHPPPPKAESHCHLEEKGVAALLQLSFRAQMTQMPRVSSIGHCAVANATTEKKTAQIILPPSSIDSIGTNISDQGTKLHENWKKCRSEQDHSGQNNLRSTEVSDVQYSKLCLNRREPPCVEGNQQDDLCSDSAESSIGSKDDNTDAASGSTTTNSDCDSGVRGIDINRQRNEIMINFQDSTSSEGVNRNPIHPWSFLHYQS